MTNGRDDNELLRLDVVDFRAFDLIAKVSSVSNERNVLQLFTSGPK